MSNSTILFGKMKKLWKFMRMKEYDEVMAHQREQLEELIERARTSSPFYQRLYSHLPEPIPSLQQLPPVTKPELMANFDDWSTDRAITRESANAFMADKTLIGEPYLGKYLICSSSGSSGHRGTFVYGPGESLYRWRTVLQAGMLSWTNFFNKIRWLNISATGDHFGSLASFTRLEKARQRSPFMRMAFESIRTISTVTPLQEMVEDINRYQPTLIFGYSTVIATLAQEQIAGRLHIKPSIVSMGGEWISDTDRQQINTAFHSAKLIRDAYSSAECPSIAHSCEYGWLHVCSERTIVEPVDEDYQPVPPGEQSYTVLITDLVNRVQPIIRYDQGDSVTLRPDPCPCGNPFPAIHVMGRKNDMLRMRTADGAVKQLSPMTFYVLLDLIPGLRRWQVIQNSPTSVRLRIETVSPELDAQTWETVYQRVKDYFDRQDLPMVTVERAPELPMQDPATGKFYHVRVKFEQASSLQQA
ncbi:MAG: phenylacetate--CoA ligase family protein [Ktedonobacteraceae bacterium]|nr:phenylacetate--CoA ligase family protein [Ktedonobacteraceae bacterium]